MEDLAEKVANQDMQLVQLRHELRDLNEDIAENVIIANGGGGGGPQPTSGSQRNLSVSSDAGLRSTWSVVF